DRGESRHLRCQVCDLAVGEAHALGLTQEPGGEGTRGQPLLHAYDVTQLRQEPEVNARLLVPRLPPAVPRIAAHRDLPWPAPRVAWSEASIFDAFTSHL